MSDTRQAEDSVVLTALYSRITIGKLVEPAPSSTEVQAMLQAAARAPDHGRLKPWRFFIVRGAALERLGEVMAEALKRRDPNCTEDQLERERQKPQCCKRKLHVGHLLVSQRATSAD